MDKIKPGKYQHYKGKFYKVIGIARHSETLEELVVNGQKVPRFKYLGILPKKIARSKYGSPEWWAKANLKAANDFAKGNFKTFNSADQLVTELRKRHSRIGLHDRVLKIR